MRTGSTCDGRKWDWGGQQGRFSLFFLFWWCQVGGCDIQTEAWRHLGFPSGLNFCFPQRWSKKWGGTGEEMRWWRNSGVTWLFQWGSAPGEIDVSNLHRFLRKGWTSVSQISEENKDKEQVADPPPLCSVPAGKREKQELGVCSVCLWALLSFLRNIPGNGSQGYF